MYICFVDVLTGHITDWNTSQGPS